jgi:3',5'-cyclic AMP phosphodiesterase CpdA
VPLRDWPGKRLIGGANLLRGRGRRFADAPRKIAALARLAREESADSVVCTGDLSALGTDAELAAARAGVKPFFEAPLGFVCLPGNHDLYTRSVIREQRFDRHFADALVSDLPEQCTDGPWPVVRLLGELAAIVAVNSARPSLPWQSSGRIPSAQLEGLRTVLGHEDIRRRFVFVATHYAPLQADGSPDTPLHGLENAGPFLDICAGLQRGAILCGHIHHAFRYAIPPELFCGGSATMDGHEAAWWFEIGESRTTVRPVHWDGGSWSLGPADERTPVG